MVVKFSFRKKIKFFSAKIKNPCRQISLLIIGNVKIFPKIVFKEITMTLNSMKKLLENHEKEIEKLIEFRIAQAKAEWLEGNRRLEQLIQDAAYRETVLAEENSELKQRLKEARSYKDYYSELLDDAKAIELDLHKKCADYHVRQKELEDELLQLKSNPQLANGDGIKDAKIDLVRLTNQIHAAKTELARLKKEIHELKV